MPIRESTDSLIRLVDECFRPFVKELCINFDFGFIPSKIDLENLNCSKTHRFGYTSYKNHNSNALNSNLADQFTIVLPYGGTHVRWEVLFDLKKPWFAPDFRFDDQSFLINIDSDYIEKNVPSLAKWNNDDPRCLGNVITELMKLYKQHQIQLLRQNENSRAYFEYTALIGDSTIDEEDVEVFVKDGDIVTLLIKLKIDFSQLSLLFSDELFEDYNSEWAVLHVKYPNPTKADLFLSPFLARVVGNISLPIIHPTAVLMDFVPEVVDLINNKVKLSIPNRKLGKEFLSRFIVKHEGAVLEHDSHTASFLFNIKNFYCILHIKIGLNFPDKPLTLLLRSLCYPDEEYSMVKELMCHMLPLEKLLEINVFERYIFKEMLSFRTSCDSEK